MPRRRHGRDHERGNPAPAPPAGLTNLPGDPSRSWRWCEYQPKEFGCGRVEELKACIVSNEESSEPRRGRLRRSRRRGRNVLQPCDGGRLRKQTKIIRSKLLKTARRGDVDAAHSADGAERSSLPQATSSSQGQPPEQVEQVTHRAFITRFGPSRQADGIYDSDRMEFAVGTGIVAPRPSQASGDLLSDPFGGRMRGDAASTEFVAGRVPVRAIRIGPK